MTATYEPFTPAGSPEPRRSRYADRYPEDRYAEDRYGDGYRRPEDPWAGQQQRSWEPGPVWTETSFAEPRVPHQPQPDQPRYEQPGYDQPRYEQPAHEQPAYAQPAYQQPGYEQPASAAPAFADPRPARSRGRVKPLVIALVAVLLGVTGWQAYRIESVIKSSNDLASAVSTAQNHSADLEKALTNVFDPEGISAAALPSVFRVRAGDFTGTAFSVGTKAADGTANLFTNFHVVESVWKAGDRGVTLERGSTRINATIVKVSEGKDLALLRAKQEIKPLGVAGGQVKPGQQVVVVGAPLGLDDTVTTGVISAFREDDADGPTIQFDAPINPGNSGGPVVNTSKQVVGLATAKARDAEGIGLAIPIATACATFKIC
ncbi:trypsin-like peptidase domain-containing protein [Actinoplanes oblitus]|uniref:Trypsin-like peptidase domain-containing protein n=1 Tax=Actinoplanes oblitus TaxID=3040509 RepID=A0ABY8WBR7_9ACTN|nr:trypsin-like peptidase domain-containing protein [Actinoplanes oblitus]WIM95286.1 trypsin-like peptidase domain-containing protein [Actinoplanes oblitus]